MGAMKGYQFLFNAAERAAREGSYQKAKAERDPNMHDEYGLLSSMDQDHNNWDNKKVEITNAFKSKANHENNITDDKIYEYIGQGFAPDDGSFQVNQRQEANAQSAYNGDAVSVRDDSRKRQRNQRQGATAQTRGGTILSGLDGSKLGTPGGNAEGLKNILGA
jgi:hypothetical protein